MEMWIEVRDAVNAAKRGVGALGERFQLLAGQVSVLTLDGSKVVEDQTFASCDVTKVYYRLGVPESASALGTWKVNDSYREEQD
jgi:hypothetical protein